MTADRAPDDVTAALVAEWDREPVTMTMPDWKAPYFGLAQAIARYQRVCIAVKEQVADGGDYWEASNALDDLLGAALCWQRCPDLYARLLRQQAARLAPAPVAADLESAT